MKIKLKLEMIKRLKKEQEIKSLQRHQNLIERLKIKVQENGQQSIWAEMLDQALDQTNG